MTRRKQVGGRVAKPSKNQLSPELEALLAPIAEQAVEQRLTLGQAMHSGPLAQLIGRFVEIALRGELTHHLETDSLHAHNVRNGSFSRQLTTEFGQVEVTRPRDRNSTFEPSILPKHGQLSDTIAEQIVSLYTRGMTTRDIRQHLSDMYHTDFDDDLVSRVLERVEPELIEWRNRPLPSVFACVFVDCLYMKIRHETGVENTAVYVAMGYDDQGMQHILGTWVAEEGQTGESASFWHKIFLELKRRGVQDIFILCADGLVGMEKAVQTVYPATRFQLCVVHLMRNSTQEVAWKERLEVCASAREIYQAVSVEAAGQALKRLDSKWGTKYPGFVKVWTNAMPKLENLWNYGEALRKMVYTTNALENVNRIIRKGTKTRGSFPNRASALRLVTLILKQTQEGYKRARGDWRQIRLELDIHFAGRLP
jgi:putative transposase